MTKAAVLAAALVLAPVAARAQGPDFEKVQVRTEKLAESVHVLMGAAATSGCLRDPTASSWSTTNMRRSRPR